MAVDYEKLKQLLLNKLRERFGESIIEVVEYRGDLSLIVDRSVILPVAMMLRDDPDFRFDMLAYMTCTDYVALGRPVRFEAIYQLYSTEKTHRLRVRASVSEDDPVIESVFSVWPGANFMEREAFDMFGVIFQNHPDLRRILMPDDWEGYPLRKEFPLGGVKSFYFKRSSDPHAGEPKDLVPRIRVQESDI